MALVVDDDGGRHCVVSAAAVVAELDLAAAEVGGGFVAAVVEAEGVVFFDGAFGVPVRIVVAFVAKLKRYGFRLARRRIPEFR